MQACCDLHGSFSYVPVYQQNVTNIKLLMKMTDWSCWQCLECVSCGRCGATLWAVPEGATHAVPAGALPGTQRPACRRLGLPLLRPEQQLPGEHARCS